MRKNASCGIHFLSEFREIVAFLIRICSYWPAVFFRLSSHILTWRYTFRHTFGAVSGAVLPVFHNFITIHSPARFCIYQTITRYTQPGEKRRFFITTQRRLSAQLYIKWENETYRYQKTSVTYSGHTCLCLMLLSPDNFFTV